MKVVYMCRPEFETGGLRERPLTENGGLSEQPLSEKEEDFGSKNNKKKKRIFFLKRGVFWSSPGRKSGTNKCIYF